MRLPFVADAVAELEEAAAWYESERRGYGGLFAAEVRRAVDRAATLPMSGLKLGGFHSDRDVRRFAVRRFPYRVITALVSGSRAVVAVAHERRAPGYWRDRLDAGGQ
jgi:hypothetical protein